MLQWIGIIIAIFGMISNYAKVQPAPHPAVSRTANNAQIIYTTINVAYDMNNGVHYFQHHDGNWYNYPPKP